MNRVRLGELLALGIFGVFQDGDRHVLPAEVPVDYSDLVPRDAIAGGELSPLEDDKPSQRMRAIVIGETQHGPASARVARRKPMHRQGLDLIQNPRLHDPLVQLQVDFSARIDAHLAGEFATVDPARYVGREAGKMVPRRAGRERFLEQGHGLRIGAGPVEGPAKGDRGELADFRIRTAILEPRRLQHLLRVNTVKAGRRRLPDCVPGAVGFDLFIDQVVIDRGEDGLGNGLPLPQQGQGYAVLFDRRLDLQRQFGVRPERGQLARIAGNRLRIVPQQKGDFALEHAIFQSARHADSPTRRQDGAQSVRAFLDRERLELPGGRLKAERGSRDLLYEARIAGSGLLAEKDFHRATRFRRLANCE